MKILKYKLVENSQGNLAVPEYIIDGGYFSSNGNNDEWLVGTSETAPEGTVELSISDLQSYVDGLTMNKLDMETMESVEMTSAEKLEVVNAWLSERGFE